MTESIASRLYAIHDRMRDEGLHTGVQRSDFVIRLAAALVVARWRDNGRPPDIRARLSGAERRRLDGILADGFEQVLRDAARLCGRIMATVARHLSETGRPGAPVDFSERTTTWVRQRMVEGALPTDGECDELAARLVAEAGPARPLARPAFAVAYQRSYEQAWTQAGAANLRRWPPSQQALGRDSRPPLIGDPQRVRRDWSQGTNRPVYERYRLRFKRSARVTAPRCSASSCQVRAPAIVSDLAMAEVSRACDIYGLAAPAHQQIIRSVVHGLGHLPAGGGWTTWEKWTHPCLPIDLDGAIDAGLADAVSSALASWALGPVGGPLVREFGRDRLSEPMTYVLSRKVWMGLLGYERSFAEPMRRCGVPKLLRTALYRHVPTAVREWVSGTIGDPDDDLWPAGTTPIAAQRRIAARLTTLTLLSENPDIAERMIAGETSWREDYRAAAEARPDVMYLSEEDAFDALRDLLEGMS